MTTSTTPATPAYPNTQLFIQGEWRASKNGRTRDVFNPATGQVIGQVACATVEDLEAAVASAQRGFAVWRAIPAIERAAVMRKAAVLVRERADQIAALMTQEQGKPLAEARMEVLNAADVTEWFAEEGRRVYGRIIPSRNATVEQLAIREPVGPVAAFTPWNFPVNQVVRKMCAALASGCSFLVKGPEETPASPAALISAFVDAGVPAGVLGLVYGEPAEISNYLIAHPAIRKITFTGSTPVGKQLAALAGQHMKRTTMELGGHAPVIIAADANLEVAVRSLMAAKFRNAGQVCIAPTRFLVHNSLLSEFSSMVTQAVGKLVVGNGLSAGTQMGPLANPRRVVAMERMVQDACAKGAKVLAGGARTGDAGNFFQPTVLNNVPLDAAVFNEEPFGPVIPMRGFDHLSEAIQEANRLPFGLAAYAFAQSFKNIHELMHGVETGMLWVNQPATPFAELPFGGVKDSGYGSEGGSEAMDCYLVTKTVSVTAV